MWPTYVKSNDTADTDHDWPTLTSINISTNGKTDTNLKRRLAQIMKKPRLSSDPIGRREIDAVTTDHT